MSSGYEFKHQQTSALHKAESQDSFDSPEMIASDLSRIITMTDIDSFADSKHSGPKSPALMRGNWKFQYV
jgi:hypothetical protein